MRTFLRLLSLRNSRQRRLRQRRGLTLAELLVATTVLALIATAMGTVSLAVHTSSTYCMGQSTTLQHARVAVDRIEQHIRASQHSESFPCAIVISQTVSSSSFPDALAIWKPLTTAQDPTGLPRVSEMIFIAPDPAEPSHLYEWRLTTSSATVPSYNSTTSWRTLLSTVRSDSDTEKVLLTDRLFTAMASSTARLGAVRFYLAHAPSRTELTNYRNGNTSWNALQWPLDLYGTEMGLQLTRVNFELQLDPGDGSEVIPFFGATARKGAVYR